jgi:hypothetical protein
MERPFAPWRLVQSIASSGQLGIFSQSSGPRVVVRVTALEFSTALIPCAMDAGVEPDLNGTTIQPDSNAVRQAISRQFFIFNPIKLFLLSCIYFAGYNHIMECVFDEYF